jgi:ferredoxin
MENKYSYTVISESERWVYDKETGEMEEAYNWFGNDEESNFKELDKAIERFKELRSNALEDIENAKRECPEDKISVSLDKNYIFQYSVEEGDNGDELVIHADRTIRIVREEFAD